MKRFGIRQRLIFVGIVMKNSVCELSQAMQCRLIFSCWKDFTDATDLLGQIIALSIVVVTQLERMSASGAF